MGMILTLSTSLSFLARNASLKLERVNNRRLIFITEPSDILSFEIIQDTTSSYTSITTVRNVIYLTLSRPRRTWMDVYINMILLSISSARLLIKCINRQKPWIIRKWCSSICPRSTAPAVRWIISTSSVNWDMINQAVTPVVSIATQNIDTLLYLNQVTEWEKIPWRGKVTRWTTLWVLI